MGGGFRYLVPAILLLFVFGSQCTAGQITGPTAKDAKSKKKSKRSHSLNEKEKASSPAGAAHSEDASDEDFTQEICTEARVQPAVEACYPPISGALKDWTAFVQATVDEKGTVIKAKTLQVLLSSGLDTPQINEFKKNVQLCAERNVMNGAAKPMLCGNRPAGAQVVVPVRPVSRFNPAHQ